jgi:hypothetical protein
MKTKTSFFSKKPARLPVAAREIFPAGIFLP